MSGIDPTTFFENPQEGRLIKLTRGYWAIVDEEDYERISQFRWHVAPNREGHFYARRHSYDKTSSRSNIFMHHFVMQSESMFDHENNNGLDNRRRNLRHCTRSQNGANRRKSSASTSSRYKGVSRKVICGRIRWHSMIRKDGWGKYLGCFDTEMDAALAYDREARIMFGEYAACNFDTDDGRPLIRGANAKFSDDQVDQVRDLISKGLKYKEISEITGISIPTISGIKTGTTRKRKDI